MKAGVRAPLSSLRPRPARWGPSLRVAAAVAATCAASLADRVFKSGACYSIIQRLESSGNGTYWRRLRAQSHLAVGLRQYSVSSEPRYFAPKAYLRARPSRCWGCSWRRPCARSASSCSSRPPRSGDRARRAVSPGWTLMGSPSEPASSSGRSCLVTVLGAASRHSCPERVGGGPRSRRNGAVRMNRRLLGSTVPMLRSPRPSLSSWFDLAPRTPGVVDGAWPPARQRQSTQGARHRSWVAHWQALRPRLRRRRADAVRRDTPAGAPGPTNARTRLGHRPFRRGRSLARRL